MPSAKARGLIDLPYANIETKPPADARNWCVDYEESMLVCHAGAYDVAMRADYFRNQLAWIKCEAPNARIAHFAHVVFDRSLLDVPSLSMQGRLRWMNEPSYKLSADFHAAAHTFDAVDDFILPCYAGIDVPIRTFETMMVTGINRLRSYATRSKRIVLAVSPVVDETSPSAGTDTHWAYLETVWSVAQREDCDIQVWASAGKAFITRDRAAILANTARPKQTPADLITRAEFESTDCWRWLQTKTSVPAPSPAPAVTNDKVSKG